MTRPLALAALVLGVLTPGTAPAQGTAGSAATLARRAAASPAPTVRLSFPARPGVCGAGDHILIREPDGGTMLLSGHASVSEWRQWREDEPPCETGDVMVTLEREDGRYQRVGMRVGEPSGVPGTAAGAAGAADVVDLGRASGQAAADFLLGLVDDAGDRAARDLIQAADLADGAETWPRLLALARDRDRPTRIRKSALFWLGRRASGEAAASLGGIVRDRTEADEIREAAVFGLAQLPAERAVPLLIELARTSDDPRVRSRALFWLADFDDPRVLDVFESILAGPGRR